jgi:death on curing protein
MSEPIWIERSALIHLHDRDLELHGGLMGIRDGGLLDSALDRPLNRLAYEPHSTLAQLAASYGFGLARNHPFVDGNKRAAFLAMGIFLAINGVNFRPQQDDATQTILSLAAGDLSEADLAEWIGANLVPNG